MFVTAAAAPSNTATPAASSPSSPALAATQAALENSTAPAANSSGAPAPAAVAVKPGRVATADETAASTLNTNASPLPTPKPAMTFSDPQNADIYLQTPSGLSITYADLKKLSEDLSSKEQNNAMSMITMNLQGRKIDGNLTDDAPLP